MPPAAELQQWIEAARWRHLAVESAGVFWIAAELGILFLVCWGREHLTHSPRETTLRFTQRGRYRLAVCTLLVLLLAATTFARFIVDNPQRGVLLTIQDAIQCERIHLFVWATFVTAWVLLETAIVYQGARGYLQLRRLLGPAPPRRAKPLQAAFLILFIALSFSAHAQITDIEATLLPQRNALYFYLRTAGVVWIAVEWVAAYVLIRSYHLLRARMPQQ